MRDIRIEVGDTVTYRTGQNRRVRVFIEDIDMGRTSPNGWRVRGPRVGQDDHIWARDLNRTEYPWVSIHPSLITAVGEGVIGEYDDDAGLTIVWSRIDQAYEIRAGYGCVAMSETFPEARKIVKHYGEA